MQTPQDDMWGHWFPFVQHNPVLGDKKSWRDRSELLRRLERDGIIVAKGILDARECAELAEDMGGWLKRQGIDCNDNKTWTRYNADHLHMSKTILGMMNTGPTCFSSVALKARSSPRVVEIFKILYDMPSDDDLVMQLQGLFWGFPPEHYPEGYIPPQPGTNPPTPTHGGFYHWSQMWMHSDRGRSTTWPPRLQCTLVLEDVSLYDHGFVFMSKSHYYHDEFFTAHPRGTLELEDLNKEARRAQAIHSAEVNKAARERAGLPPLAEDEEGDLKEKTNLEENDNYIQLTYDNVKYFEQRGCQWKKVVAPKGSIIIWDSRLIHSTCSPSRGRPFPRARFIVFGGYVPRAGLTEEEKEERVLLFKRYCKGIDRQILMELLQRGPKGRLKKLMGLEEVLGGVEVEGVGVGVGVGGEGGEGGEEEEKGGEDRGGGGGGGGGGKEGVEEKERERGGRRGGGAGGGGGKGEVGGEGGEEGERKEGREENQKMAMIKLKGLEGAWSWKEKEAANALLVMMRPAYKNKR